MKKLTFLTAILLALPMIGFGQNVNIPDANFKAYLVGNSAINTNGDNQIQVSEASAFNGTINVNNLNINSLIGIEAFVSLTTLKCSVGYYNTLTSLDVSACTALSFLECHSNYLTSLNVSGCTALTFLRCLGNSLLTSLDVSANTALTTLYCRGNQLTSLDVSANTALIGLDCSYNNLISLDVSANTALTYFDCSYNNLISLDVSANTALTKLYCSGNDLTSLDVSTNTALSILDCSGNELTSLDVSANTALYVLNCYDNNLTSLDVSANTVLGGLYCYDNQLTCLNVNNGNNINMLVDDVIFLGFDAYNNPNLSCIEVDDVAWSNANWANPNSIDSTASFSLNCNCSGAGISDINESNTLMLYPNPTNGDFTITGLELVGTVSSLTLTDMNGKVVKVLDTKATKFSMASIKPGVYFLNIISGNKQEVLKIVKE